jgi:polysaccharide export outer membrane protein
MKKQLNACILTLLLLTACTSSKHVVYLQDIDAYTKQDIDGTYEVLIQPDDLLLITVNSRNQELAMPFNLPLVSQQLDGRNYSQQRVLGYLVDQNGEIDFPVLGKLKAGGLTRMQLTDRIKKRLIEEELVGDAVVTVQFQNFKVSVMGEVAKPGSFIITGDRITLLEALSMAGDLTIYGRRDRVTVIREKDGLRTLKVHDLRSSDIFTSPYYYLQQNDVVYVEPNKTRAGQSGINQNSSAGVWVSIASLLTSVAVFLFK